MSEVGKHTALLRSLHFATSTKADFVSVEIKHMFILFPHLSAFVLYPLT